MLLRQEVAGDARTDTNADTAVKKMAILPMRKPADKAVITVGIGACARAA